MRVTLSHKIKHWKSVILPKRVHARDKIMQEIRDGTGTIYLALEKLSSCHRKLAPNICDMDQQPQQEWQ